MRVRSSLAQPSNEAEIYVHVCMQNYSPLAFKLVMGLGKIFLTQIGSFFCCSSWVRSATSGFGKFPLKSPNFLTFSLGVGSKIPRSKLGQPLIYCVSKVCSGRVGSWPISISN